VATLATLKLSAAVKPTNIPAVQVRRNKLAKRLWEQTELAKAQQTGTQFTATKFRTVVENDTGLRKQVEVNKRIKQWWFTTDSGKLALSVRYGARLLELAKGKFAVELASEKELVPTLEIIKAAVLAGELDAAIDAASNKLRDGFQR
jgi:Na+-translocating ferredoxin:NAD+ oxidoreductase RnfC subunit